MKAILNDLGQTIELFGYDASAFLKQAETDGWTFYRYDDDVGRPLRWEIGTVRGDRFETDADAEEYVAARAAAGDQRCVHAIAILAALASLTA